MYLGFDYHFALGRQAELIRWAEHQRKVKRLRASQHPGGADRIAAQLKASDRVATEPIEQRRAS